MPRTVVEYRCLVISPSDVPDEREAITDVIHRWSASRSENSGLRIEPVRWETHASPEMGDRPQAILNRQIVDSCDFGIAVFWTRLGSPSGEHESGSIEEIEKLVSAGRKVAIFHSNKPVRPNSLDQAEYQRLRVKIAEQ